MSFWSDMKENAVNAFFPRRCPLCGTVLMPYERICGKCSDNLVYLNPPVCRVCGRPVLDCACDGTNHWFERCVSPFDYTKAARAGLHRLKFHNSPGSAVFFGRFMAETVSREYQSLGVGVVTCVPMHYADQRRRGYNQAALLATSVGETLELPVYNNIIAKTVLTNVQHSLTRTDRRDNVHGAFEVTRPYLVTGKTVLLCDDIITTGATLDECSRVLLEAGAKRVVCVTAAAVVASSQRNVKRFYV